MMAHRIPRIGALVGAAALLVAAPFLAPKALRHLDVFLVREVEVTGTRLLDPYTLVRAAGLGEASSVFDDPERWMFGVLTLPLVESVEVRRRLPAGVEIRVREVEPVALVTGSTLRPVDASGRLLPLETAGALLDLPLLTGVEVEAGRVHGVEGVLGTLVALRGAAPDLMERVSQVDASPASVRLLFRDLGAEALLPARATPAEIRQLRLAVTDLTARGELDTVRRIDLRFRDQVVVSFLTSSVS